MPIILNKKELANSDLRRDALDILEAGLQAIQTEKILKSKLRVEENNLIIQNGKTADLTVVPLPLRRGGVRGEVEGRVVFVGIGKCALDGARAIEEILGDFLTEGAVIDVRDPGEAADLKRVKYFQGTHPLPSQQNIEATKEILKMTENLTENDLVICLVSGGGSALFELPRVPLDSLIQKTQELTARGADIYELNAARKEMSQVKGGKFAQHCSPARVLSLIFSDVLGNDLSVIASGPTVIESIKKVQNILLCSNTDALEAMKMKSEELGYATAIETETLSGNAAEKGRELAQMKIEPKTCLLFGGETTVKVKGGGTGGRNQELVLSALLNIAEKTVLISCASDGWDNSPHAGAIADIEILEKAKQMNLSPEEFLQKSDSYDFFKRVSGAISTGRLGSNVSDLVIMIANG